MFTQSAGNFCSRLNIRLPIIQAPMAGGIVTPALMVEVAKKGGLASLPLGYLSIAEAQAGISQVKALMPQPFAVNIFVPSSIEQPSKERMNKMLEYINTCRLSIGLPSHRDTPSWEEPELDELLAMVINEKVAAISLTFGVLSESAMKMLRQNNIFIMGTATTIAEGLALEKAGCDAVIAQGYEAGGHRGGGFLKNHEGGLIGTFALIPQMVDALKIPVIASGGIMDGRGIAAALILGASAVQLGTAFLMCDESNASAMHKHLITDTAPENTCLTSSFTGKAVRSLKNDFITQTEEKFTNSELPPYPLQHKLTQELRKTANQLGLQEFAGLWSGQGTRLSRSMPVSRLMELLEHETGRALKNFISY